MMDINGSVLEDQGHPELEEIGTRRDLETQGSVGRDS